ncbi:MAG: hypothetical protein A2Z05_07540 [Chloroflexi bacterium RBG_16_60_22]|nr:MAG: hypothetical protein A2Z05_07540 [Chloroflexi bacterium RBG_16_60_22]
MRVADKIMDYLADIGVTDIFLVPGGGAIFLNDALARSERIRYYCCHHEQAVAMSTEAYARVKGSIGVSMVTTGPGGTNAVTGVVGSWVDAVPHLVISGQVYLRQTIGDSGVRQMGSQEINIVDIVRPVTKYAVMIQEAGQALYEVQKAVHIANSGKPGPVWVDIPADIQNARVEEGEFKTFDPEEVPPPVYDRDLKEKAARVAVLLKRSRRPLLHIGRGVEMAGAADDFLRLVERYRIPFVTARNANHLVDWDHELYAGRPGTFGQRGANFAVQNADVYIAVGTRLSLPQTGYDAKDYARNATRVMVEIDRPELEKKTLAIDIKIHADAGDFLAALSRQLGGASLDTAGWVKQCQEWKKKYPVVLPEYRKQKEPVNSYYFIDVLSDILRKDDVIVTDMGLSFQGTHQAFRVKKGQKFFTNSGFSSMGWGLPAAVGACVAHDRRRVICIAGDGGLQMTIQELATVMHHKLPVKLFVYNNGGYLTMKQSQQIAFGERLIGCNRETGISFPDMMKIGEAYRIPAVRISRQENLKEVVRRIVDADGPAIAELMLDPDQPQIPKAIPLKLPDGTTRQTRFEDMYPFLDRDELKANMIAERDRREE